MLAVIRGYMYCPTCPTFDPPAADCKECGGLGYVRTVPIAAAMVGGGVALIVGEQIIGLDASSLAHLRHALEAAQRDARAHRAGVFTMANPFFEHAARDLQRTAALAALGDETAAAQLREQIATYNAPGGEKLRAAIHAEIARH